MACSVTKFPLSGGCSCGRGAQESPSGIRGGKNKKGGSQASGGGYIEDIADLALPFSLILAQRTFSHVSNMKNSKQMKGGSSEACLLCNTAAHQAGGRRARQNVIENEYRRLASELRSLLDSA